MVQMSAPLVVRRAVAHYVWQLLVGAARDAGRVGRDLDGVAHLARRQPRSHCEWAARSASWCFEDGAALARGAFARVRGGVVSVLGDPRGPFPGRPDSGRDSALCLGSAAHLRRPAVGLLGASRQSARGRDMHETARSSPVPSLSVPHADRLRRSSRRAGFRRRRRWTRRCHRVGCLDFDGVGALSGPDSTSQVQVASETLAHQRAVLGAFVHVSRPCVEHGR